LARLTGWLRRRHPAQLIVFAFAFGVLAGTALLLLPFATVDEGSASFTTALFTSTSALCVTGLIVVDTPTYWTQFGQVVILGLIQVGGIGIMTLASLLALLVARRLGLRTRLLAQAETAAPELRASGPRTTWGLARRSGAACSTRCRRSTTRASPSGATASSGS
jgi:trk system potassium uptake protein TrkH